MAKKRKSAKPVRVAPGLADWMKRAADEATLTEGRIITVVEASGRLALALDGAGIHTLDDLDKLDKLNAS